MKSEKNWVIKFSLLFLSITLLAGCTSTVIPKHTKPNQPSFDGNQQNSGLLGFTAEGSAIITSNAVNRYNFLIEKYPDFFTPPVKKNEGVKPAAVGLALFDENKIIGLSPENSYEMDAQHLSYFLQLVDHERNQ
jgi:hypothetical protein